MRRTSQQSLRCPSCRPSRTAGRMAPFAEARRFRGVRFARAASYGVRAAAFRVRASFPGAGGLVPGGSGLVSGPSASSRSGRFGPSPAVSVPVRAPFAQGEQFRAMGLETGGGRGRSGRFVRPRRTDRRVRPRRVSLCSVPANAGCPALRCRLDPSPRANTLACTRRVPPWCSPGANDGSGKPWPGPGGRDLGAGRVA